MKKKRKAYISSESLQKGIYKKKLSARYNLIYADNLRDADILIVPVDQTLTQRQELDINTGRYNRISISIIDSESILKDRFGAVLDKEFIDDRKERDDDRREKNNLDDDLDYGLELRLWMQDIKKKASIKRIRN